MKDRALEIWQRMCRVHYFDEECARALNDGRIRRFTYLSSGQEAVAAAVSVAFDNVKVNVFPQHRNHDSYLCFGGDPVALRDELLERPTGTTKGIGGDPCHAFRNERVNYVGHIGLVGDQVPMAVGHAFASGEWSVCFMGDATAEEDVWAPSLAFAARENLPVLFVELDNDLSVITSKAKRRTFDSHQVAEAYGVRGHTFTDGPISIAALIDEFFLKPRPHYLRVFTNRKYQHVGGGMDGEIVHNRIDVMRERVGAGGKEIEDKAREEMKELWA